jgi:hypothetical protein
MRTATFVFIFPRQKYRNKNKQATYLVRQNSLPQIRQRQMIAQAGKLENGKHHPKE